MPSAQIRKTLVTLFNSAPSKKSLGISIAFNDRAEATCTIPRNPAFDHAGHDVHGGVLATLLDTAAWFTAAAQYEEAVVTADLHVRMLRPAKCSSLTATAQIARLGARTAVTQMQVVDERGELVAIGTASLTKFGPLPT